jgi:glucosylceramidase
MSNNYYFFLVIVFIMSCGKSTGLVEPEVKGNDIPFLKTFQAVTNLDKTFLLKEDSILIEKSNIARGEVIEIDQNAELQTMQGFGYTLTGSSAYLINKMSSPSQANLLNELFDCKSGSCISYLRISIGASDLDIKTFSYNDAAQEDFELKNFSMGQDEINLIPILKKIKLIQPGIKLLATPWSPPTWMKTNKNTIGGSLRQECYGVYSDYLIRYLK